MFMPRPTLRLSAAIGLALAAACTSGPRTPTAPLAVDYVPPLGEAARTQIMVLATAHLHVLADCLGPSSLDAVLEKLRAWHPDVIAIESLPAVTIEAVEHRDDEFAKELRENFASRSLAAGRIAQDQLHLEPGAARRGNHPIVDVS
jgi:hypothetical protein